MTRRNLFTIIAAPQVIADKGTSKVIGKKDKYKSLLYEAANHLESKIIQYGWLSNLGSEMGNFSRVGQSVWVFFHTEGNRLAIDNAHKLTYGSLLTLIDTYAQYGGYSVLPSTHEVIKEGPEMFTIMSSEEANRRFSL